MRASLNLQYVLCVLRNEIHNVIWMIIPLIRTDTCHSLCLVMQAVYGFVHIALMTAHILRLEAIRLYCIEEATP